MLSKKNKIMLFLVLIIIFISICFLNPTKSYGSSVTVENNREPRIVLNKKDKDYLYITLHDKSGIIKETTVVTFNGNNRSLELIERNDGIYADDGRRIKDIIRKGGSYSGKKYDYGVKIKNSELLTNTFKNIYIFAYDYGHACFIKETFKIKKYDNAINGEYYNVNRAPRLTVKAINNIVKVDAADYSGIKSIKILSKKSNEVVYSFEAGKSTTTNNSSKGKTKNGYFYPFKVVENIDMNLIEKAQKDTPGRYRFRVFVEDSSGLKSEKTMTTHVYGATNTASTSKTSTSKNTNKTTNNSTSSRKTNQSTSISGSEYELRLQIANFAYSQVGKKLERDSCKIFGKSKSQGGWCSEFVSWCAYNFGYTKAGVYAKADTAPRGSRWYKDHNAFRKKGSYTPRPGDVCFTGSPSHTCIVYKVTGNKMITIDGGGSKVHKVTRKIKGSNIYGYGVPLFNKVAK